MSSSELLPNMSNAPIWRARQTKANTLNNWEMNMIWDHCGIWQLLLKNGCHTQWLTGALLWFPNVNLIGKFPPATKKTMTCEISKIQLKWTILYCCSVCLDLSSGWGQDSSGMSIQWAVMHHYMESNRAVVLGYMSYSLFCVCVCVHVDITYPAFK